MSLTLQPPLDTRSRFQGTFVRYDVIAALRGPATVLVFLRDIIELASGTQVASHLSIRQTRALVAQGAVQDGDCITFEARVRYRGHNDLTQLKQRGARGYRLTQLTNFLVVPCQDNADDADTGYLFFD